MGQDCCLAGQLAHSAELKKLLEDEAEVPSGFHAVLKLAWGVMLKITGDDDQQTQGQYSQMQQPIHCLHLMLCVLVLPQHSPCRHQPLVLVPVHHGWTHAIH